MALTTLPHVKLFSGITDASKDALINQLIPAVSAMIERHCDRAFESAEYTEWIWSYGGKVLYLRNYPVTELARVCNKYDHAIRIRNTSADAQMAAAEITTEDTLILTIWGGANAGSDTIDLSLYASLTLLAAAITALGKNWESVISSSCNGYDPTELMPEGGNDALTPYYAWFNMPDDPLEVQRVMTDGRVEGSFPKNKAVWVQYTAGYSTIPSDLENICIRMIVDLMNQSDKDTSLKSEAWPHYRYTLNDSVIQSLITNKYADELDLFKRVTL